MTNKKVIIIRENLKSIGKEEMYCDWFRCPVCNKDYIVDYFNYCPNCGTKIIDFTE